MLKKKDKLCNSSIVATILFLFIAFFISVCGALSTKYNEATIGLYNLVYDSTTPDDMHVELNAIGITAVVFFVLAFLSGCLWRFLVFKGKNKLKNKQPFYFLIISFFLASLIFFICIFSKPNWDSIYQQIAAGNTKIKFGYLLCVDYSDVTNKSISLTAFGYITVALSAMVALAILTLSSFIYKNLSRKI